MLKYAMIMMQLQSKLQNMNTDPHALIQYAFPVHIEQDASHAVVTSAPGHVQLRLHHR